MTYFLWRGAKAVIYFYPTIPGLGIAFIYYVRTRQAAQIAHYLFFGVIQF
jgi:hypothetical protein